MTLDAIMKPHGTATAERAMGNFEFPKPTKISDTENCNTKVQYMKNKMWNIASIWETFSFPCLLQKQEKVSQTVDIY